MLKLGIQFVNFCLPVRFFTPPRPRRRRKGARATTQMAADTAANRADLIDRLLVGFVNVPAGVVLPMIGAIVSIMFYFFNNHMFQ